MCYTKDLKWRLCENKESVTCIELVYYKAYLYEKIEEEN